MLFGRPRCNFGTLLDLDKSQNQGQGRQNVSKCSDAKWPLLAFFATCQKLSQGSPMAAPRLPKWSQKWSFWNQMAPKMEPKGHPETSLGITFDEHSIFWFVIASCHFSLQRYQRTSEPAQQHTSAPSHGASMGWWGIAKRIQYNVYMSYICIYIYI